MKQCDRHAFTLVELLVVIVIIGMLMALLIPAVSSARARARQAECSNNQRNLGMAVTQYQTQKRRFPGYNNLIGNAGGTLVVGSWAVALLPNLGRNDLMKEWRMGNGFDPSKEVWIEVFVCPSDDYQGKQPLSYVANCGYVPQTALADTPPVQFAPPYGPASADYKMVVGQINRTGVFADRRVNFSGGSGRQPEVSADDIKDGAAQTLMLGERVTQSTNPIGNDSAHQRQYPYFDAPATPVESKAYNKANLGFVWTEHDITGTVIRKELYHVSSNHPGVSNVTYCDGHQQALNDEIDAYVYQQIMTPWGQNMQTANSTNYTQEPLNEGALNQ